MLNFWTVRFLKTETESEPNFFRTSLLSGVCLKMIVEERCVVAAKIDLGGHRLQPAFRLPLRTKIELHFYGRWKKPQVPPIFSCWDCMAEEVSKPVYYAVTGPRRSCLYSLSYHIIYHITSHHVVSCHVITT